MWCVKITSSQQSSMDVISVEHQNCRLYCNKIICFNVFQFHAAMQLKATRFIIFFCFMLNKQVVCITTQLILSKQNNLTMMANGRLLKSGVIVSHYRDHKISMQQCLDENNVNLTILYELHYLIHMLYSR